LAKVELSINLLQKAQRTQRALLQVLCEFRVLFGK